MLHVIVGLGNGHLVVTVTSCRVRLVERHVMTTANVYQAKGYVSYYLIYMMLGCCKQEF